MITGFGAMGIPTSKRLKSLKDFQKVRALGHQIFCKAFIFQYYLHQIDSLTEKRIGVIASRRVGKAVKRNYGKRIVRELFRIHEANLPLKCDIVIILRSTYSNFTFSELESQYLSACANICKNRRPHREA